MKLRSCRWAVAISILGLMPVVSGCASLSFMGQSEAARQQEEMLEQRRAMRSARSEPVDDRPLESLEQKLQKGDAFRRVGNYAKAMWSYLQAHELDVEDPAPIARMASLHLLSEPERAEGMFQELIASHPDSGAAYTGLGLVRIGRQEWTGAQEALRIAIEKSPNSAPAHSALGVCLDNLGEPGPARESYQRAIALHPGYYEALNNLGVSYLSTGEFELAERALRQASKQENRDPAVFNNLGLALGRLERYDDALKAFRKLGSEQAARSNLGYVAYLNEDYERAAEEYEKALLVDGGDRLQVLRNLNAARQAQKASDQESPAAQD